MNKEIRIAVIGLGYVGLPLARLFSTKYSTVGFDLNRSRVDQLMRGHDATLEVEDALLQSALESGFTCTTDIEAIRGCNFYVVAVPTPVDCNNNPDLRPLYGASETVGRVIAPGDIPHSLASVEKAKRLLGYDPQYSLREGLREAVKWYRENS